MSETSSVAANPVRASLRCRIDVYTDWSLITPTPPKPLFETLLEYRAHAFKEGGERGYQCRQETNSFVAFDPKGRLQIPTGLVEDFADLLSRAGYGIDVQDHRAFGQRLVVDEDVLDDPDVEHREMLEVVRREPMGRIEAHGLNETVEKMATICRLYPKARIIIPVASKDYGRNLRWKLSRSLGRTVHLFPTRSDSGPVKIMVCTFPTLEKVQAKDWDILLLPDAMRAIGKTAAKGVARFVYVPRAYGFVSSGIKLSPRERIWLASMCGPVIHRESTEHLGVEVLWLSTPRGPKLDKEGSTALQFKRQAYWRNGPRNDYVASVARAFAEQDRAKLTKYNAPFPYTLEVLDEPREPLVVVLVESTEHGRELRKRLKGWEIIDAVPRTSKTRIDTDAQGYITTLTAAKKYGLRADVIVRATGSTGALDFQEFPNKRWDDDDPDAVVVDFKDEFDETARAAALARKREYLKNGWKEVIKRVVAVQR